MSDPTPQTNYASPLGENRKWFPALLNRQFVPIIATVSVFVLIYTAAAIYFDNFLTWRVFQNLFQDNSTLGLAAIGMTFVILSGGIDLSVGAMIGLVSISIAVMMEQGNMSPYLAIPIALLGGTLFGLGQGAVIALFALPPFLVTLAGLFLARGLALIVSRESISIPEHPLYTGATNFTFEVFPVNIIVFLALLAAAIWIAHQTRFGRSVYAVGGNEQSALFMGVSTKRTKLLVYAFSGFCAALAGVMSTFYTPSGSAIRGEMLELDAIAAVVIGGTLLTGGVGYVAGTLVGVLILGLIQTILNFDGRLDSYATRIFIGVLLLVFILLQKLVQGRAAARPTPA